MFVRMKRQRGRKEGRKESASDRQKDGTGHKKRAGVAKIVFANCSHAMCYICEYRYTPNERGISEPSRR